MNNNYFIQRECCPGCKSTNRSQLYKAGFTEPPISTYLLDFYSPQGGVEFDFLKDSEYILDECKACGLVYQRLIPNDFLLTKLYEEWIDPDKALSSKINSRGVEYYALLSREIESIVRHFGIKPAELEFLDFGMGWGEWCQMAKAYGCSVSGGEISQARIDHASTAGIPIISGEEIPNHRFDFINTEQVFEHLANPLETLLHLVKGLKPHGLIKLSVPNGADIRRRLAIMDWKAPKGSKNSLNPVAPLEHINCFSYDSLVRMAQLANLVPVQIQPKIRLNRRLLDYPLRDILKPLYHSLKNLKPGAKAGSTYLFFRKNDLSRG